MSGEKNSLSGLFSSGVSAAQNAYNSPNTGLSAMGISPLQQSHTAHQQAHLAQLQAQVQMGRAQQRMANQYQDFGGVSPTEEDLATGAMEATMSELEDMWTIKFGDRWVNEDDLKEDRFWQLAFIRLFGAKKLEKIQLVNQFKIVYRIIR